jgi:hypothetical protein
VDATVDSSRRRPALLPRSRWARLALLLLVLFALLRSVLWASVQPAWLAPDEDYHWLYVNYLVEKHTVPHLGQPFYTAELYKGALLTQQGIYLQGPRRSYRGDPHAVLRQLGGPLSEREPAPPDPRPVLHPPGFYLGDVLVDEVLWHKVSVTRLTGMRYYSALLGAITIFFAWLLAAQVLAREWQQLAAAAIASTQPILAFSASTMTNDVGVAAVLTAMLAWCAWMLRAPPRSRQGIGLGLLIAAGVLVKATLLSLVIVTAVTLALLWLTYPSLRLQVWGAAKWAVALPVVLAGWWYVYLVSVTGSILGEKGSLTASQSSGPGILHVPSIAWQWLTTVYRSYWFDYLSYEVRRQDVWFWLPVVGIIIVAAGFALLIRRTWRTLTDPGSPELRQVFVLVFIALLLLAPPWSLDTYRGTRGLPFIENQGRFLTPAYSGLAVIAVLALRELTARRPGWFGPAAGALVIGSFVFYCHTWIVWVLERFYGPIAGHWLRALYHASYDKPNFITQGSLAALALAAAASFIAAFVLTVWGTWPARSPGQDELTQPPVQRNRVRGWASSPAGMGSGSGDAAGDAGG